MRILTLFIATLVALALVTGCGEKEEEKEKEMAAAGVAEVASEVEAAAGTAGANVERSIDTMKETYDEERAEGEGRIEAAGDAYNEVLDDQGL